MSNENAPTHLTNLKDARRYIAEIERENAECQEWRCHDKDINNAQVERIRELEASLEKYQACRVHDVDEKAWLSKRVTELAAREATWGMRHERETAIADKASARVKELEAALRKFGKHNRELGDCWPKCECGLEAALGSALETKVKHQAFCMECGSIDERHYKGCSSANRGGVK